MKPRKTVGFQKKLSRRKSQSRYPLKCLYVYNVRWNQVPTGSNHSGGAQFAMMDGSARFVNENVQIDVLLAAAGMKDGRDDDLE